MSQVSARWVIRKVRAHWSTGSAILSYQLGLVGWYGGPRVLDLFVVSKTVPKRVKHVDGRPTSLPATTSYTERQPKTQPEPTLQPDVDHTSGIRLSEPEQLPVEQTLSARFLWALDLMIAMRGCGWDFASADVRHTSRSWHPPPSDRLYALLTYILPSLVGGASIMRHIWCVPRSGIRMTYTNHPQDCHPRHRAGVQQDRRRCDHLQPPRPPSPPPFPRCRRHWRDALHPI
jgi:hypothetical protein